MEINHNYKRDSVRKSHIYKINKLEKRKASNLSPEGDFKSNSKIFKMNSEQQKVSDISVANLKAIIKECNEEVLGRISTLSEEVNNLKTLNDGLIHEMELMKMENNMLKRRLTDIETNIKGKNLVIRGLSLQQTNISEIQKLCQEVLKIENRASIKSVKTLYQRNEMAAVLVEFDSSSNVEDVLKKTSNLKGTHIYIERDLNAERRLDKVIMLQLRRQLLAFSKKHQVKVRDDRIQIGSKWFKWNMEKNLVCGTSDALNIMQELYGDEFNLNIKYYIIKKNVRFKKLECTYKHKKTNNIIVTENSRMFKKQLKILSYNVHGLKNKCLYPEFFNYIGGFEIFALLETHVMENQTDGWFKYFKDFHLCWYYAEKSSRYGRASGGIVCGVKKDLYEIGIKHTFRTENNLNIIHIQTPTNTFIVIPAYIRQEHWTNEFNNITEIVSRTTESRIILAGDMNIRIGKLQQNLEDCLESEFVAGTESRKSKDDVVNSKGTKFMEFCDDKGLMILNGKTLGDEEGHFTYLSTVGSSVNDIAAVSYDALSMVRRFEIEEKIWSDHLPLRIEIEIEQIGETSKPLNPPPKLQWKDGQKNKYLQRLNNNLNEAKNINGIENLNDLVKIIQNSSTRTSTCYPNKKYKSIWYNGQCEKARVETFKCLNKFRKTNTQEDKSIYLDAVKAYKFTCKNRKMEHMRGLEIQLSNAADPKQWWRLAKQIRGQTLKIGTHIKAREFRTYFSNLLNQPQLASCVQYAVCYRTDADLDGDISVMEIQDVLKKAKDNKSPGMDGVPYEFLKQASYEFLSEMAKVYSKIFITGDLDNNMEETLIFPIHKKGNLDIPGNYRGISFMNTMSKVFMGIIKDRITKWINHNKVLNEYQAGFRPGYSTVDNIYNLASIVHCKFAEKKKVYAFFVDFSAAFDMISRYLMVYKLHALGLSTKVVNIIKKVYQNTKSMVWTGNDVSDHFNTYTGVRQGCLLSPLLFTLYLNDLHEWLEGGLMVEELNIRVLLYADDIVIVADDICVLQNMIWNLEKYCKQWNMMVNLEKSKIMIFRNGGRVAREEKWKYMNQNIEIVSEYCYLGVTLTSKMTFTAHLKKRNSKSKNCINATWKELINKPQVSLISKWKIFQSVCRSIQSYAAQVWGFGWFEEVDKLQRYFLKRVLKLPEFIPNYVLSLETDIPDGHFDTLKMHINYIYNTIFKYNNTRLPHKLSIKVWTKNIFWASAMKSLAEEVYLNFEGTIGTPEEWEANTTVLLQELKCASYIKKIERATASQYRIYRLLNPDVGINYMRNIWNMDKISVIMKTRADVLPLHANSFSNEESKHCTICNTGDIENMQHFIAKCPILRELRVLHLGKTYLEETELIKILNGDFDDGWNKLYNYVRSALRYRKCIIDEQF